MAGVSLGLGSGSSSTSSNSLSTTSGTSKLTGTTKSVQELLAGDLGSKKTLDDIMGVLFGASKETLTKNGVVEPGYTKQDAISDSQAVVADIFRSFSREVMPQIFAAEGSAGAYNSTGAQLMANDAFASTTSKAASAVLGNIKTYADITAEMRRGNQSQVDSALNGLLGALGLQQSAIKSQSGTEDVKQTTKYFSTTASVGTSKGKSLNAAGSFSGGATA